MLTYFNCMYIELSARRTYLLHARSHSSDSYTGYTCILMQGAPAETCWLMESKWHTFIVVKWSWIVCSNVAANCPETSKTFLDLLVLSRVPYGSCYLLSLSHKQGWQDKNLVFVFTDAPIQVKYNSLPLESLLDLHARWCKTLIIVR